MGSPNTPCLQFTNQPGYRLRIGDWRVVYLVEEEMLLLVVARIAPRGEVYQ